MILFIIYIYIYILGWTRALNARSLVAVSLVVLSLEPFPMKTRLKRRQCLKQTSLLSSSLVTAVVSSHFRGSAPDFLTGRSELQENGKPEILYNGIELKEFNYKKSPVILRIQRCKIFKNTMFMMCDCKQFSRLRGTTRNILTGTIYSVSRHRRTFNRLPRMVSYGNNLAYFLNSLQLTA